MELSIIELPDWGDEHVGDGSPPRLHIADTATVRPALVIPARSERKASRVELATGHHLRRLMRLGGGRISAADGMQALVGSGLPTVKGRRADDPPRVDGRTVTRIHKRLGIKSRRAGFGKGSRVWWFLAENEGSN